MFQRAQYCFEHDRVVSSTQKNCGARDTVDFLSGLIVARNWNKLMKSNDETDNKCSHMSDNM